jgi:hypothetical protein
MSFFTNQLNKLSNLKTKIWYNSWLRRSLVIFISSVAIFGVAGSCSLPGALNSQDSQITYGVLKQDPEVRQDGFVRANAVRDLNGELDQQGLTPISSLKIDRVSAEELYLLTIEKGLFKSNTSGVEWSRLYLLPVGSNAEDENQRTREIREQVAVNDALTLTDFAINPVQSKIIFVAANDEEGLGKIYRSLDGGENFQEIYTEVEEDIGILFLTVDPVNPLRVYAVLEEGALIRSLDGGITWQKIRSFRDTPVQIGFVPEFREILYILFEDEGLAVSTDGGENFDIQELTKAPSEIGERQPEDGLDISFSENETFGKYEKIIPVTAGISRDEETGEILNPDGKEPWILIADRQMWFSEDRGGNFQKLVLPIQSEQVDILDVAPDPNSGLDRIIASVDDRMFITRNQGQTWSTQDFINLSSDTGNIGQVLIEPTNTDIIYITLVNEKARRKSGLIGF